jgi:hypothetical protein
VILLKKTEYKTNFTALFYSPLGPLQEILTSIVINWCYNPFKPNSYEEVRMARQNERAGRGVNDRQLENQKRRLSFRTG